MMEQPAHRGGKFMLVYQDDAGYVYRVSRICLSPASRVSALVFSGTASEAEEFARERLRLGSGIRTVHADGTGDPVNKLWRWGSGDDSRSDVSSRKREKRPGWTEVQRVAIEMKLANRKPLRGVTLGHRVRVARADYYAYLETPEWQAKRKAALHRAKGRCQVCNGSQRINVHHRTYERLGNERRDDLLVLCRDCHDLFHKNGKLVELSV